MNIDKYIKNLKLHLIGNLTISKEELSLYNDIISIFNNLKIYKSTKWHCKNFTFYGTAKDELYICYSSTERELWINGNYITEKLMFNYNLNMEEVNKLIHWYLSGYLNIDIDNDIINSKYLNMYIMDFYKLSGRTKVINKI